MAPADTSTASGAKAVLVKVEAFIGIVTGVPGVATGPGAGDGVVDGEE
jgi:hypothetical protein